MENAESNFIPTRDLGDVQQADNLLTASQLVEKAHEELKTKLNREIRVPKPPSLLLETQRVADGEGFKFFEPIYFPKLSYRRLSDEHVIAWEGWIDWLAFNGPFAVKGFKSGSSNFPNPSTFGGFWALFDKTPRPNFNEGKQLFDNDEQLGSIIAERITSRQENLSHVPKTSRFGISLNDVCSFVFTDLSRRLRLEDKVKMRLENRVKKDAVAFIRTPKLMEFNFAGNTRYPFLGKADTWEWLYDTLDARNFLICGSSDPYNLIKEGVRLQRQQIGPFISTGLAAYSIAEPESSFDKVAFRPVIVFGKDHFELSPTGYRRLRQ